MAASLWRVVSLIFGIVVLAAVSSGANDYGLCGRKDISDYFYETPLDVKAAAINLGRGRSDLIITDPTSTKVYKTGPNGSMLYGGVESVPSGPPFCLPVAGTLRIADVDGNGKEDLLCHKTDGSISVRYYMQSSFLPEEIMAPGFSCNELPDALYIGDFDGNGAQDFMCVNAARDAYTIYFNRKCDAKNRNMAHHSHYGMVKIPDGSHDKGHFVLDRHHLYHGDKHSPSQARHACDESTARMQVLSGTLPCSAPADTIVIADVNGDKSSDIVCHTDTSNVIVLFVSSGVASGSIFTSPQITTSGTTCVEGTHTLYPVDIDGDGDQDLVCLEDNGSNSVKKINIAYASGVGLSDFEEFASRNCWSFCSSSTGATTRVSVGDFDGDGRGDLFCRIDYSTRIQTQIAYAELRPN